MSGPAVGGAPASTAPPFDYLFKIVLVGDSGVGKSNLLSRFTRDVFTFDEKSTIGVEFATRTVTMSDGKRVKAQIWDTAGQERYRAVSTAYYRGALGAMLVYDTTKPPSFNNIPRWLKEMKDHANKDIVLLCVGNKLDVKLTPQDQQQFKDGGVPASVEQYSGRAVPVSTAEQVATQLGLPLMETSAMTDYNVERAFVNVIERIYALQLANKAQLQQQQQKSPSDVQLTSNNASLQPEERKCCT